MKTVELKPTEPAPKVESRTAALAAGLATSANTEMIRSDLCPDISQSPESDPGRATRLGSPKSGLPSGEAVPARVGAALADAGKLPSDQSSESAEPQDWSSKIAVWIGGVALLLAGFYMIKYSIDSGWMTPLVRVWLTTGFGVLLCGASFVIGVKSAFVANERIGQALSGAGIAYLYFAAYAAVHLYGFLNPGQGFVAMLTVTVLAVALSLKNGAPIALMGLVGGFLTPWLMSTGSNDTVALFTYLFLLFCGAQFLCVRRGWWALLLGSLVGVYLWSAAVIVGHISGTLHHLEGTLIFVLGICLVNAVWSGFSSREAVDASSRPLLTGIRWLTWGGGLVQGFLLVLIGGFAAVDMVLFSVLSLGALGLAVWREDDFIWAAWLAFAAVAAATLSNASLIALNWLGAPLGLMGLFFIVGHWRGLSSERTLVWRSLSVGAALLVVPLLYLNREWITPVETRLGAAFWLGLSLGVAGLLGLAGEHLYRRQKDVGVAGEYSAFALFLVIFGLWIYVPMDIFAHTMAGLLLLSALYWKYRGFGRSELVLTVLAGLWGCWMLPYGKSAVGYFFQEMIYGAVEQDGQAILAWAAGWLGLSVVWLNFGRVWDEKARGVLACALGLVAFAASIAAYQWLDGFYMPEAWTLASVGGGLTTLLALAAVALGFGLSRWPTFRWPSLAAAALAGVRIVWLHLSGAGAEGESFFWNALLLQFGVPFVACCVLAWQSGQWGSDRLRRIYQMAAMVLGFIWATFLVQDYFGGSQLIDGHNTSTEIYTYSVVWLLLAVAYQAIGLWRQQPTIHVGSLILLLVTIGKVFLIDASELEGLYRVLSFLGLGLALLGIGFFYNKVVFARRGAASASEGEEF